MQKRAGMTRRRPDRVQVGKKILSWIKVKKAKATNQKLEKRVMRQLTCYENYVLRQMKKLSCWIVRKS
jgi:hypothetical protein